MNGLVSLSVRGHVGTADYIRIMGFVLSGSESVCSGAWSCPRTKSLQRSGDLLNDPKITLTEHNSATNITGGSTTESGMVQ